MEAVRLTKAQKRNIRRTKAKENKSEDKSTIYSVGDVIIAASRDIEYISDTTNWCHKGEIIAVKSNQSYTYYIVKLDLPVVPDLVAQRLYGDTITPPIVDHLSVTKERYGDKYRDIIATNMGYTKTENVEHQINEHHDHVIISHDDVRKSFPASRKKITIREALYHSWFVENITAVGYVSMLVDKKERQDFFNSQDRWNFYDDAGRMNGIEIYKFEIFRSSSIDIKNVYVDCHCRIGDECDEFVDRFHLVEHHEPYGYSKFEQGERKMCMIQFEKSWNNKYRIKGWKVIPDHMTKLYYTISETRKQDKVTPLDAPFYEYFDKTYEELPKHLKKCCNTLLWARPKIYSIQITNNSYYHSDHKRTLIEVN